MYKNRISRTTLKITPNTHPQFFIRRSDIAFDERVRYIESVCQVLIESRFGACFVEPVTIDWSDRPEPVATVLSDLLDDETNGQMSCYAIMPLGRAGYHDAEATYQRAKDLELLATSSQGRKLTANSSPDLGRGSP